VLVALSSATTRHWPPSGSPPSRRPSAPGRRRCTPTALNRTAVLPAPTLSVFAPARSYDASPHTQISLLERRRMRSRTFASGDRRPARTPAACTATPRGRRELRARGQFRSGETGDVRGKVRIGSKKQRFAFQIRGRKTRQPEVCGPHSPVGQGPLRDPHTARAGSQPAVIAVTARTLPASSEDMFAAPYSGPGKSGPMIFDEAGNLVGSTRYHRIWTRRTLQVQQYNGRPVLTWCRDTSRRGVSGRAKR